MAFSMRPLESSFSVRGGTASETCGKAVVETNAPAAEAVVVTRKARRVDGKEGNNAKEFEDGTKTLIQNIESIGVEHFMVVQDVILWLGVQMNCSLFLDNEIDL